MKKILVPFLFIVSSVTISYTQVLHPANWDVTLSGDNIKKGDSLEIIFKVTIDKDWYLYSSDFDPDLGPMVTEFNFKPHSSYQLIDSVRPINPNKKYDEIWEGEYTYFKGEGAFQQTIKILSENLYIEGNYIYQVCSDIDGKCIPFDETFKIQKGAVNEINKNKTSLLSQRSSFDPYSLLSFMIVAFLAGLAALLTPCVFPMIPLTVTFFSGKSKGGRLKAFFYGFSIILIYTLVGSILAPFMGPEVANELATGWLPNIIFFVVFVVFALSFFGLFEITLPHKIINTIDKNSDRNGLIGIFFMAFTLVLVSFSCTGPIVGSLLVESAGGLFLKPILGMFSFALAFALPFTLFALFPGWLNNLPKSGGWLNSVKVVLGFLELAFAFKFLSIADQAYHWGILDREIYLAIWIAIFTMMGFYILGKLRLKGDPEIKQITVPRLILSLSSFVFVIYLIPGMWGAPLKSLAGYLPPLSTHDFNILQPSVQSGYPAEFVNNTVCDDPKYEDILDFPHGIKGYFDFSQALDCAKEQNKPLFIDFTGHGCVNCREMEARVWSDPEVLKRLKKDFVVAALYVDDKTTLPKDEWYKSDYDNKIKKTIGKQNADLQITKFNNNAQPYYVILNTKGELVVKPRAYDLNISEFIDFLDKAKVKFYSSASVAKY